MRERPLKSGTVELYDVQQRIADNIDPVRMYGITTIETNHIDKMHFENFLEKCRMEEVIRKVNGMLRQIMEEHEPAVVVMASEKSLEAQAVWEEDGVETEWNGLIYPTEEYWA